MLFNPSKSSGLHNDKRNLCLQYSGEDKRAFSIFEFDEAHLEGATEYFKARYEAFGKVKDLVSNLEEWLNVQDALEVVEEGDFNINTLSSGDFF